MRINRLIQLTLRYFPWCLAGFSPASFLSNFPPLAVEVAAIPAAFPRSSLVIFLGAAWVPVMGKVVAASWTWLHEYSEFYAIVNRLELKLGGRENTTGDGP